MELFAPWGSMMRRLVLLAALPVWAGADPNEIVRRFIEADSRNWERASQYTYVQQTDYFSFDKDNQPKKLKFNSETHEIVFVEGETYKKLVAQNGSPLKAKAQAKEEERLKRTAKERRKQRRSGLLHKSVSVGSHDDLLTLFDNRLMGEEEIRGRKAWIIVSTPKAGRVAANAHEKEVRSFQRKLWIDEADYALVRSVYTVVGRDITFLPGSTITWEYEKIGEDAWLAVSGVLAGQGQFLKFIKLIFRTEYRNSKFRKFDVQSTITTEPVN